MLLPDRVNVPVPVLVKPPVPLITPAKAVSVLLPPVVKVPAPSVTLPPVAPPPAKEPMLTLLPFKSRTTPAVLARVTAELLPKALVLPACKVPSSIAVPPV